jgi:hypothetical protein
MNELSESLNVRVAKWLDSQGYPLEMRVARMFRSSGFRVVQSDYFSDPETGTSREIDVVATTDLAHQEYLVRLSFVVECKASRDKPWVAFASSTSGLAAPARVAQRAGNVFGTKLLRHFANDEEIQSCALFTLNGRPVHGVTQAFTSGQDTAYSAIHGAAKAAAAFASRKYSAKIAIFQIIIPLIVIDGRLFEYSMSNSDEFDVTEVAESTLLWRNPIVEEPHTIIDLVTLQALAGYVARARSASDELFAYLKNHHVQVVGVIDSAKRKQRREQANWVTGWRK